MISFISEIYAFSNYTSNGLLIFLFFLIFLSQRNYHFLYALWRTFESPAEWYKFINLHEIYKSFEIDICLLFLHSFFVVSVFLHSFQWTPNNCNSLQYISNLIIILTSLTNVVKDFIFSLKFQFFPFSCKVLWDYSKNANNDGYNCYLKISIFFSVLLFQISFQFFIIRNLLGQLNSLYDKSYLSSW